MSSLITKVINKTTPPILVFINSLHEITSLNCKFVGSYKGDKVAKLVTILRGCQLGNMEIAKQMNSRQR